MTAFDTCCQYSHIRAQITDEMLDLLSKNRYCICRITEDLFLIPEHQDMELLTFLEDEGIEAEIVEDCCYA